MRCLVTGGAGMIGAALVNHLLAETDWDVHVVDSLTYAALEGKRLAAASRNPRFSFAKQDVGEMNGTFDPNYIVHLAAETHVDRSIRNPLDFILSNVMGTYAVLQYARQQSDLKKFLYFSTDEVFGPPVNGEPCDEDSPYSSGNPYAASKAAGEELTCAWGNTYGIPFVISHCSNVIGSMQHEEKFIPKLVRLISEGKTVKIHADKDGNVGSRMYVHACDVARAIEMLLLLGNPDKYNIPGKELSNLEMAVKIANILDRTLCYEKVYADAERPGWDFAYRITGEKIRALGWEPSPNFDELLRKVVLECLPQS